ncbi:Bug family tripartite tricarboxylate transporter substrate binding protein [Roseicella frigidaeris]|uniref:Bug family tripartite tricarboxylate transporter substrate binding protein n=1 Tax=Roseicella frigidaeris TaxID=2230885 RepID=UPI000FDE3969|nr:tripartite tricarboxylate transporter substrate binding protein [Roseicella frigidaeris]
MRIGRRGMGGFLAAGLAAARGSGGATPAAAQTAAPATPQAADWPQRPVTIISPFAAGGQSDPIGRAVALHLQRSLGQPFVLENRSGAGGTIGAQFVARAAADGHTLLFGTTSSFVIAPFVYREAGYDPAASFAPVAVVSEGPMILTASPGTGFRSVAEVVAAARRTPGEVTYASAGNGSLPHLLGELLARSTGTRLTHVPYRGGAPAMNDLIGGQVDLFFEAVANVAPHVEGGRVVALMGTGQERTPLLPQVPTAGELELAALTLTSWTGLAAPAGTPAAIVERLNAATNEALRLPAVRALLERSGIRGVGGNPAAMAARIGRESGIYRGVIAEARIAVE